MKKILFLAIATALFAFGVNNASYIKNGLYKGPEVNVHQGKSWTWVKVNKQGKPEKLGITLTDQALNSVPAGNAAMGHAHGGGNNWVVKFNTVTGTIIPFNHVSLNWNPMGHEPEHIYGKPHFDFHFYSMTPEEVAAIPAYEADSIKFKNWPAPDYFPKTYINPGGGVPQMGAHWIDVTSGEFNGKPFTETFLFGSFNGQVIFYEPMITQEFLKAQSNYERAIPSPVKFQKAGWYPTVMKIQKHDGLTDIVLDGFIYRQKS
jgi:hypothetical protein